MGRANVYLPDDLERRVKAAGIAISEVCQRALLTAVEAAEQGTGVFDAGVTAQFGRGRTAGADWVVAAAPADVLRLLRDQHFDEIPAAALPADLYSLTEEQSLAWEAGFADGARTAVPVPIAVEQPSTAVVLAKRPGLGDDSGCQIGVTLDGEPVSFDPHAAVRAKKSPIYAVLGDADLRARLTLTLAQDAAARGTAVVVVDLSGELSPRATGLGRNVRVIRGQAMPQLDDLMRGAMGLGGLMQSGAGLLKMFGKPADTLIEPGYVSVLNLAGDGALATMLSAAQGLSGLLTRTSFPRLILIDLPSKLSLPEPVADRLGKLIRTAREQNAAVGLSAGSAETVQRLIGSGALLSTIFAFATSNPVEADLLRGLLGNSAPVLLNAPGSTVSPSDEAWAVMRDLDGRIGQVRIEGS